MTVSAVRTADPERQAPGSASRGGSGDVVLAERIARRDPTALSQVIAMRFATVFAIARRMVGSDADAEDVAQDVFLALWRNPPDLSAGTATLATWLYRVAANRSIDRIRRKRPGPLEEAANVPARQAAPDAEAAGTQVARRIDQALIVLPDRQRLALTLTYYEGLSNTETAEIMETSVDALESLLRRARARLRRSLEPDWRELLDAVASAGTRL